MKPPETTPASRGLTTRHFATVSIRVLGVAALVVGGVFAGSSGIMRALGAASLPSTSTSDLHLHDTYYVISHVEDAWLAPGVVSVVDSSLFSMEPQNWGKRSLPAMK